MGLAWEPAQLPDPGFLRGARGCPVALETWGHHTAAASSLAARQGHA